MLPALRNNHNRLLAVTTRIPGNDKKYPLVMLLQGYLSTQQDAHITSLARDLTHEGFVTITMDYSGIGESEGTITEDYRFSQFLRDTELIYGHIRQMPYVDPARIALFGHSLGGGVAVYMATKYPEIKTFCGVSVKKQVENINFTTPLAVWKKTGWFEKKRPDGELIRIPYAFIEDLKQYHLNKYFAKTKQMKLLILGTKDKRIPPEITRKIYQDAPEPKIIRELPIEHDYKNYPEQVVLVNEHVVSFLKEHNC